MNSAHPGHPFNRLDRQRGIALVMVLWLLVLMTVIASSHSRNIRTETRLASNHVESGKARSLAEAGVYHAIMELLVTDDNLRWPANGSINRIQFDDGAVDIAIRDTRGLVDINSARGAVLDRVLAGAGVDNETQRQALIDAILDWRDSDHLKHLYGAEDDDYRYAGLSWAARDDLFTSVEEFRYILGMTNPLFEKLAPYLTVHSGKPDIHLEYAPPWLAGVLSNGRNIPAPGNPTPAGGDSTFRVTVQATTQGGTTASLSAVVRITARSDKPFKILSWRTPATSTAENTG